MLDEDEPAEGQVERRRPRRSDGAQVSDGGGDELARRRIVCDADEPAGFVAAQKDAAAVLDDRIELERPEILVYERLPDGEYRLNGVEYIVPFSVWPADAAEPPTVMGQDLKPAPRLRLWYLHVWIWLENPSGLFADWNPRVTCEHAEASEDRAP